MQGLISLPKKEDCTVSAGFHFRQRSITVSIYTGFHFRQRSSTTWPTRRIYLQGFILKGTLNLQGFISGREAVLHGPCTRKIYLQDFISKGALNLQGFISGWEAVLPGPQEGFTCRVSFQKEYCKCRVSFQAEKQYYLAHKKPGWCYEWLQSLINC